MASSYSSRDVKGRLKCTNVEHKTLNIMLRPRTVTEMLSVSNLPTLISLVSKMENSTNALFPDKNIGANRLGNVMKEMSSKHVRREIFRDIQVNEHMQPNCTGLDEQKITRRTGHRSLNSVRKYRCAFDDQFRDVSNLLKRFCLKK